MYNEGDIVTVVSITEMRSRGATRCGDFLEPPEGTTSFNVETMAEFCGKKYIVNTANRSAETYRLRECESKGEIDHVSGVQSWTFSDYMLSSNTNPYILFV